MNIKFNHVAGLLVLVFGILLLFTKPIIITGASTAPVSSANIIVSLIGITLIIASIFLLRHEMNW
ncbi:MAG TPA: hypothetical protein VJB66_00730 [Candidatus Nanoarchaeia archaeon]|nr:hypothetical protein [Candidatus Nanoarchaeia archaeon]